MQGRRTKDISEEEYGLSMLQTLRYPNLRPTGDESDEDKLRIGCGLLIAMIFILLVLIVSILMGVVG